MILKILILAIIQGAAELLPISSSAHVIIAEKFMGLDPTSPEMTLLLVMLHTGTMLAVITFFWRSWRNDFPVKLIVIATIATAVVGLALKVIIEKVFLKGTPHAEVELLFGNLPLIAVGLAAAGVLILLAGYMQNRLKGGVLGIKEATLIGMVQGVCLPFRGFSRSGSTISTGLLLGIEKHKLEDFSFALAVVLTPPVILKETLRLLKSHPAQGHHGLMALFFPSLIGMALSFISGTLALKWLSNWLERGRWHWFGVYCLCAAAVIFFLYTQGL